MKIVRWTTALAFVLPLSAAVLSSAAQADDTAYCRALAARYQMYFVTDSGHYRDAGPIDGNIAAEQCRAGNLAGIPVLEQLLRTKKIDLPARG
jgi:hypothetical protein